MGRSLEERLYGASPALVRTALLNAHAVRIGVHRYGPPYRAAVAEFNDLARGDAERLDTYKRARLREIVGIAYRSSQFYRRRFDALGVRPEDITGPEDLVALPLLTREELRDNEADVVTRSTPARNWLHGHTSGTTGSPLSLWYDRRTCIVTNAADRLQKQWGGMRERDWVGLFLGRTITPLSVRRAPFWHANYVQRQVWFSSFHLSEETLPAYLAEIRRRKLRFLEGYPSTLYILARFLLASGTTLPMRAVFSSSETLLDVQRETIEEAFETTMFDYFGHAERAVFAIECEHHAGKHIVEPFGHVEIVDGNGVRVPDGVPGFIVGTSLHNIAMPMIRYRTTDVSAIELGNCTCGRTFRRMRNISTKAEDIVVLPDGRWISPSILTHPFKPYPQIKKSQVIQETPASIRVLVVADHAFQREHEEGLLSALRTRLGVGVSVTIERVEEIPNERSGKFRWVVSRVPHSLRVAW